jgi:hypothetical protein
VPSNAVLEMELQLRPGWHINSHLPLQKALIPTQLRI